MVNSAMCSPARSTALPSMWPPAPAPLSREVQTALEAAYTVCPHPDLLAVERLAASLAVSDTQIQVWFRNRRQQNRRVALRAPAPLTLCPAIMSSHYEPSPLSAPATRGRPDGAEAPLPALCFTCSTPVGQAPLPGGHPGQMLPASPITILGRRQQWPSPPSDSDISPGLLTSSSSSSCSGCQRMDSTQTQFFLSLSSDDRSPLYNTPVVSSTFGSIDLANFRFSSSSSSSSSEESFKYPAPRINYLSHLVAYTGLMTSPHTPDSAATDLTNRDACEAFTPGNTSSDPSMSSTSSSDCSLDLSLPESRFLCSHPVPDFLLPFSLQPYSARSLPYLLSHPPVLSPLSPIDRPLETPSTPGSLSVWL